jgi:hypothetical protein
MTAIPHPRGLSVIHDLNVICCEWKWFRVLEKYAIATDDKYNDAHEEAMQPLLNAEMGYFEAERLFVMYFCGLARQTHLYIFKLTASCRL